MPGTIITVTQLNRYVKSLLEGDRQLNGLMVQGEISNYLRHYKSGHIYFTLKEGTSAIKAVMFRSHAQGLRFEPANGMSVIISGSVSLYERDGSYQIYVTDMQPEGIGALHLHYEQLRDKLMREGLFDESRKRPLPPYPETVGIITSEGAAALQDMLNILSRRNPSLRVVLCPAQVQGEGAAKTLIDALRALNEKKACDVIIMGRGGGSIEDLWAFNDEALARAIAESAIPVISGVGHETDFTIADFVADLRAPTPSAAAELVSPARADILYYIGGLSARCQGAMEEKIERPARRLAELKARLGTPETMLKGYEERLKWMRQALRLQIDAALSGESARLCGMQQYFSLRMRERLKETQACLSRLSAVAEERSPLRLLRRGYSLTRADGKAVTSISQINYGDEVETRVLDGVFTATVKEIKRKEQQG